MWVNRYMVYGVVCLFFVGDKMVFMIKEQDFELFDFLVIYNGVIVVDQCILVCDDVLLYNFGFGELLCGGFDDFQFGNN